MQFAAMTNFNEERFGINRDETEKNSFRHFVSVDTKRSFARTSRLNARSGRGYDAFFFYQRGKGEIGASRQRRGRIPRSLRADRKEGIPLLYSGG